jgi:hypothetical protein
VSDFDTEDFGVMVWLIEMDENYSLENVQRALVDGNPHIFGDSVRVRHEVGRVKSIKKLLAWANRKGRNRFGHKPMTGWYGPIRLDPKYLSVHHG